MRLASTCDSRVNSPLHTTHHDTPINSSTEDTGWLNQLHSCLAHSLHDRSRTKCSCLGPGEPPDSTPWNRSAMAHYDEATNRAVRDVWSQASPD